MLTMKKADETRPKGEEEQRVKWKQESCKQRRRQQVKGDKGGEKRRSR